MPVKLFGSHMWQKKLRVLCYTYLIGLIFVSSCRNRSGGRNSDATIENFSRVGPAASGSGGNVESGEKEENNSPKAMAPISEKRGLAYGHHSVNDLAALRSGIQWWYNWAEVPESSVLDHYEDYDLDFVPMAWDERFNEARLRNYLNLHPNVKYLLGFNEPNFKGQANLTPAEAAAQWPRLEAIARSYNLKIVGPAVNFSPGEVDIPGTEDDSSPWEYLDAFFAACTNCQVDYIAIHSYMKYPSALQWYVGEFEKRYKRPIWVTEWASWDDGGPTNVGEQMNYLATTVRWLEANPNVFRYAWFVGRSSGGAHSFPYIDILGADGELTPLGNLYTHIPSPNYRYPIPMRIEAEGAHRGSGFRHEPIQDADGNVGLVLDKTGAWLEYDINVPNAGPYRFQVRAANAMTDRKLTIYVDGNLLFTQDIFNTGGEQIWKTFSTDFSLTAGSHTVRIEAPVKDFAINWIGLVEPQ
jgi:hypothetical protein